MAKRFTESKIWDDIWFQELPAEWKLLWKYICDKCDEAGVWKVNYSLAEFQLKTAIKWDEAERYLNNGKQRIRVFNGFWIIKDFVVFQYGEKVFTSVNPFHQKIRDMLDRVSKRVSKRVLDTHKVMVKEKDKVLVKDNKGIYKGIIEDLNLVLKTNYKVDSTKNRELIEARFAEGHTLEDFKTVHRKMAKAWGLDNKMRQYLRPITLYSNKFESYLNRPDDIRQLTPQQQSNLRQLEQLNKEIKDDERSIQ
jgi:uncharacterized phage protein (TIGR02220 family)